MARSTGPGGRSTPGSDTIAGSSATGTEPDTGRVITLSNSSATSSNSFSVFRNGPLISPSDYVATHTGANDTVTFTNLNVFDADQIVVFYYT